MWKIKSIQIQRFRGLIGFNDRLSAGSAIFVGQIASGKTRILQAIRMALQGECHGPDDKRIKLSDICRDGDTAEIRIVISDDVDGENELILVATADSKTFEFDYHRGNDRAYKRAGKDIRAAFLTEHKTTEQALRISLDPYRCIMDADALGDALAKLADDSGDLAGPLKEFCGDQYDALVTYSKSTEDDLSTLPGINQLGATFYSDRTECNRSLKKAADRLEDSRLKYLIAPRSKKNEEMTVSDIPALETLMRNIQDGIEIDSVEFGKMEAQSVQADPAEIQGKLDAVIGVIGRLEKDRASCEKAVAAAQKEYDAVGEEDTGAQVLIAEEEAQAAVRKKEIDSMQLRLSVIEKTLQMESGPCPCGGDCPKCDGTINLTDDIRDAMNEQAAKLEVSIHESQEILDAQLKKIEEHTPKQGAGPLGQLIAELETKKINLATTKEKISAQSEKRDELSDQIAQLNEAKPEPSNAEAKAKLTTQIATDRNRVKLATESLETLRKIRERDIIKLELDDLRARVKFLEWGIDSFHKAAFQKTQMGEGRALFEQECNRILAKFDRELRVQVDGKKPTIEMRECDGEWFPIMECSNGERVICAMGVGAAYANGGPVLIDNVNDLDGKYKNKALFMAKEMLGECTFFLALTWSNGATATDEQWQTLTEAIAPVVPIWVEAGKF